VNKIFTVQQILNSGFEYDLEKVKIKKFREQECSIQICQFKQLSTSLRKLEVAGVPKVVHI